MYDVVIIGGGPAGIASGVYSARKKMKTLFVAESFGGQSVVSDDIQNWIGDTHISGVELAKKLENHLRAQDDIEILDGKRADKVEKIDDGFRVIIGENSYDTRSVIVCAGARHRRLGVPGEDEFDGRGVAFCSTCDAPLFAGKKVVVVGAGNSGLEAAQDLLPYAGEVYLMIRRDVIKGDPITLEKIKRADNFKGIIENSSITEILGETFVKEVKYRNNKTGKESSMEAHGVFVEIGAIPNSEIVADLVDVNEVGEIVLNHRDSSTSLPGIYAAGDITDVAYKQNNISAGDGVKAALSAYHFVNKSKK